MRQIVKLCTLIALVCLALSVFLPPADAQQTEVKKSPFAITAGSPTASANAGPANTRGIWGWVLATQAYYHRELATAVRDIKSAHPLAAAATLAFISFAYGVLHAAGPGHGKAVISSYVLANRQTVRRGILLSFLAAFFQAVSAIALVGVLAIALKATSLTMRAAESWIEIVSWALVALVGVWLLYRQIAPLVAPKVAPFVSPARGPTTAFAHVHADLHAHTPGHGYPGHVHGPGCSHGHTHATSTPAIHVHDANCGHVHMPEPAQLQGPWDWGRAISLAMSVGIRPCTGAILVMLFALSQGILWAGIFATFMMSIGTALTVSVLAALAVGSRDLAVRLAGLDNPWAMRLETSVGIVGALAVVVLGTAGFVMALSGPAPF